MKQPRWARSLCSLGFGLVALCATTAHAITFTGSKGSRSASVSFVQSGDELAVTLENTSNADVLAPRDVLTAVFFTLAGDPHLQPVSALVLGGDIVLFGSPEAGGGVGGEWAYKNHLAGAPRHADEGISSSGLGLFGPGNRIPGLNLQGPKSPDGLQYGITSAGDNPATGNAPVTGLNALIDHRVMFTFDLPEYYIFHAVQNVSFQYGTSFCDANIKGYVVPEPGSFVLVAIGIGAGLCLRSGSALPPSRMDKLRILVQYE